MESSIIAQKMKFPIKDFFSFFFYSNVVQKLKSNEKTVPQQQYCVLSGKIKILYNNYKDQENKKY